MSESSELQEMRFVPPLRDFLNARKQVYTVRKYRMRDAFIKVSGVGTCRREFVHTIDSHPDLEPYVSMSGFDTVTGWWVAIQIMARGGPHYLYRITQINNYDW